MHRIWRPPGAARHVGGLFLASLLSLSLACDANLTTKTPPQDNNTPAVDMGTSGQDQPKDSPDQGPSPQDMGGGSVTGCGVAAMFTKLEPTCGSCHRSSNSPYFVSSASFYNLIVNNPRWVVPGEPDQSGLIALLKGQATGAYAQMPLGEESFEVLAQAGKTQASVEDVRQFITDLKGCSPEAMQAPDQSYVQRKSARQIHLTLKAHLGLEDDDIVAYGSGGSGNEERYPIWPPDSVKRLTNNVNIDIFNTGAARRWHALGGESYLRGQAANRALSPTFGQTITQVAQAWCRISAEKRGNTALYRHVDRDSLSAATPEQIKQNLRYLMLRFWGHEATDQEVDDLYVEVYEPYAQADSAQTGWIATCAALIRDPMWLVY